MAIFSKKKKEEKNLKSDQIEKNTSNATRASGKNDQSHKGEMGKLWSARHDIAKNEMILRKPRITEKSALLAGRGVYTFEVTPSAGKNEVKKAFKKIYGKDPVRVNMVNKHPKKKRTRFGMGKTNRKRVALVFLKKGETIDFV